MVVGLLLGALVASALPGRAATASVGRIGFNAALYRAYLSELDGQAPRELPRPPGVSGISTWPSWSPDGTQVAYGVEGCGASQEYAVQLAVLGDCTVRAGMVAIARARGGVPRTVMSMPATYIWTVDWARKGGRLAVEVAPTGVNTPSLIYVLAADGSGRRLLTAGERPVWAPDGRRLAYVDRVDRALYVLDVDADSEPVRVSPPGVGAGREEPWTAPAWSPDGRRIAFVGSLADGGPTAWVVDSAGAGGRVLPGSDYLTVTPSWSPDSRRLAFVSTRGLLVSRSDGSGRRRLVSHYVDANGGPAHFGTGPAWSPDGRWIAFLHTDRTSIFDERRSLRLIRPDGSGLRQAIDFGSADDSADNEAFAAGPPLMWAPA
jgi:Tol biopolymer transport system component